MGQKTIQQQRRLMTVAYACMFFALFTVITAILAYVFASKVTNDSTEVWIQTQALWVMRNITLFAVVVTFGALWFSPLYFYTWDAYHWVTGVTIVGIIFCFIAWMILLNAFFKGFFKYLKHKAVF